MAGSCPRPRPAASRWPAVCLCATPPTRLPHASAAPMTALNLHPWETLLIVNLGLLLVGSFLEPPAAIMLLTPLLLPLVQAARVPPIHFGIIMAVNLSIGMYTPPFGLNLFASQARFKQPLGPIYRGV